MMKNKSFINSGNHFSKSLFLKKNLKETIIFICESKNDIVYYKNIFKYLGIFYKIIDNYAILNELKSINTKIKLDKIVYLIDTETLESINISKNQFDYLSITFENNRQYDFELLTKKLIELNYTFSEYENYGTYYRKGDLLTIISIDGKTNYKISFWDNLVEEILVNGYKVDKINIGQIKNIFIESSLKSEKIIDNIDNFFNLLSTSKLFFILDNLEFYIYYKSIIKQNIIFSSFDYIGNKKSNIVDLQTFDFKIKNLLDLKSILSSKKNIFYTKNLKTIQSFIDLNNIKNVKILETRNKYLKSFYDLEKNVICDDIIKEIFIKRRIKKSFSKDLDLLMKIKIGDFVVHIDHGIGVFKDIIKREIITKKEKILKEYLQINYLNDDKLFVPIEEVSRLSKYVGEKPKLTTLGGNIWEKQLQKAKKQAETIAEELIEIYAKRKLQKGFSFKQYFLKEEEFRNDFPFEYTKDQKKAIFETLEDMKKQEAMDRLIVGDVGFGKTEIAFNAIYRAYLNKKQSVLIVPLVVLAYEHYDKAVKRFSKFGLKVGILTRLESQKQLQKTLLKIKNGDLNLLIGTHKLLSDKVLFKDLGLLVIDEEHKFGVKDKEKIKEFKENIDSLAMSATPIPRSLNMALSNIRQLSILKTPISGRQNIATIIDRYSEEVIKEAGIREFNRGGQMFFVHNRVSSLENIRVILSKIFKGKKIVIAHGQMTGLELEKSILDFKNKKYDILLSTTVIENGIDFSNVNTIIINNAPSFGLSQIHQLRGRVGRSSKKGYCYLLYKNENLKSETAKRLKTLAEYSYLGAGFELAMKDLEIRGAGDLLGFRQSGIGNTIGINLYLKILEEKIEKIQKSTYKVLDKKEELVKNVKVDLLNINIFIDNNFFPSELDKINFYREIEYIETIEELEEIKKDFISENNETKGVKNLFNILELKLIARKYLITEIRKKGINYELVFYNYDEKNKDLEKIKNFLDLDKEIKFVVKDFNILRTSIKNFESEEKFIQYLLSLFKGTLKKVKLIKRKL